ncbi:hypothetical protein ACTFIZ_009717 [Dictyostelium cf. discoideum]
MSYKINSIEQKRNEDEIINFISNSSLKDRSLLLLYISKLSSNGLYIPSISSLINFCEEIIILKDTTIENRNPDLVAKWYWADDDINGNQTVYKPYSFKICKRLEKARKNKIDYCRISDVHFVDTVSLAQIRYDDKGKVRLVRRDPPKYKENEILPQQEQQQQQQEEQEQQEQPITTKDKNDDNGEFIQWYWADDGPRGHQDVWVKYNKNLSKLLEASYQNNLVTHELIPIKVDEQRYVDTRRMLQVRYDCRFKVRLVKRDSPPQGSAPPAPSKSILEKLFRLKPTQPSKTNQKVPFVDTSINLKTLPNNALLNILTIDEIKYLMNKLVIAIPDSSSKSKTSDQTSTNSPLKKFTISAFKSTFILNNNQILSKIVLGK